MIDKNSCVFNILRSLKHWCTYTAKRSLLYTQAIVSEMVPNRKQKIAEYPVTIQLPITWKCNFDCVMCGMHYLITKEDFTASQLEEILHDKLFSQVKSVGVNGGEPFLKKDIIACITAISNSLPNLREINFISNGYFTHKILTDLEQIKLICGTRGIKLNISFSVDGVGEMQDYMRGRKNAWKNVNETITAVQKEKNKYCDTLGVICTITRHNIFNIEEVENWAKEKGIVVAYNVATVNARIDNYDRVNDFSIFSDSKATHMAQEFFYKKFYETHSKRYFGIYLYIHEHKRYAPCECACNNWVTLTPDGCISYCATHSKILGSAYDKSPYEIFNGNINYLKNLTETNCETCSHYIYTLNKEGRRKYYKELLRIQKINI